LRKDKGRAMFGILRIVIAFFIFYLLYKAARMLFFPAKEESDRTYILRDSVKGEDLVEDPYCHTYLPLSSAYQASIKGKTLYFCSRECFEKYRSQGEEDV
jgi:YHS domain-containing protein